MKRGMIFIIAIAAILAAEAVFAVHMLSSSTQMDNGSDASKRRLSMSEFDSAAGNIVSSILSDIYEIPKAYVLPLTDEAMPVPDADGYTVVTDSDISALEGTDILRYEDETVCVTLWKEYVESDKCHAVVSYAEIKIAHPTQLRRHLAGWEYGDTRRKATSLYEEVNAVVALSGDFYSYRRGGIVILNGQLFRDAPSDVMADILFVDSNGDFIIEHCDSDFDTEGFMAERDIMFSMSFGPALVDDGHVLTADEAMDYDGEGGIGYLNPRAAVGQLGTLHYLFVTVDGRTNGSNGMSCDELAQLMSDKGCIAAYNLDGGASATMVFNGGIFNTTPSGGQRYISDIIFIATANSDSE